MPAPLKDQICYTLYATSMAVNRLYKPMLDAMGITYPQYLVLNALNEADGQTVGGVAEVLALESSTVTPLVKRLEQAGLVTRQRSRQDERLVQVFLTETGRDRLAESTCLNVTLLQRSGMSFPEINALNRELQALRDLLVEGQTAAESSGRE
ncbi:MarR family winged helix-turn-helix transcriptional regulator [Acidisoma cellulosilyticum]|nr:MarR family transcriptional regulator [Acidisoma cellulosilyticum]